jgi:conjugative transfer region protein TrbK
MRGRPFQIQAIARAAGYIAVAVAITATALHFRQNGAGTSTSLRTPSIESDPLAPELARCQSIGMVAKDDPACEAAWAENRRRFFTYRPADSTASAPTTDRKPAAKSEGQ